MDRDTFNFYVMLAYFSLKTICQEHGERLADIWVHYYVMDCEEEKQEEFLEELIECSTQEREAWDALILIVQSHHIQERLPLPKNLEVWNFEATAEYRQKPKAQGNYPYTKFVRDLALVSTVFVLTEEEGINATRNLSRTIGNKTNDYPQCCYEGGSAIDIVGVAWDQYDEKYEEKSSEKPRKMALSYKRIENIWRASASPESPFYRLGPSKRPIIEHPKFILRRFRKK